MAPSYAPLFGARLRPLWGLVLPKRWPALKPACGRASPRGPGSFGVRPSASRGGGPRCARPALRLGGPALRLVAPRVGPPGLRVGRAGKRLRLWSPRAAPTPATLLRGVRALARPRRRFYQNGGEAARCSFPFSSGSAGGLSAPFLPAFSPRAARQRVDGRRFQ